MIIDKLEYVEHYQDLLPGLKNGVEALRALPSCETGRYEFEGGYFMIQEGVTKPMEEGTYEAHRKYIDVQILLKGCEELAWSDIRDLASVVPYQEERDQERFDGPKKHVMLISEGMFYAVFPHDGHQAVSHTDTPHRYRKAVMKLPVTVNK